MSQLNPQRIEASLLRLIQNGHQIGMIAVFFNLPMSDAQMKDLQQLGVTANNHTPMVKVDMPSTETITALSNLDSVNQIYLSAVPH